MASRSSSLTKRLLDIVKNDPGCLLDDVIRACPELSWNQVFWEVDRLSRTGQIRLNQHSSGNYTLRLP